jgi:hypothetical protein
MVSSWSVDGCPDGLESVLSIYPSRLPRGRLRRTKSSILKHQSEREASGTLMGSSYRPHRSTVKYAVSMGLLGQQW